MNKVYKCNARRVNIQKTVQNTAACKLQNTFSRERDGGEERERAAKQQASYSSMHWFKKEPNLTLFHYF